MAETITGTAFSDLPDLADWRVMAMSAQAMFRAGSFERAASFVQEISAAAEAANHHPDIDVRYPDRVHVSLSTHTVHGLTTLDVALARQISGIAVDSGIRSEPLTTPGVEVGIDAMDIDAVRPFWQAVLGYAEVAEPDGGQVVALEDPQHLGPSFWFQQMDEVRPQRNRLHIDVIVPHDQAEERVAAALAAGGTLVTDRFARSWWVLADPEGNEACVCTWQDRD
jgi:4a-hydroxytetrahydrobiopterin dehydratase